MAELTLESLAKRVEALETALASKGPKRSLKDCMCLSGLKGE